MVSSNTPAHIRHVTATLSHIGKTANNMPHSQATHRGTSSPVRVSNRKSNLKTGNKLTCHTTKWINGPARLMHLRAKTLTATQQNLAKFLIRSQLVFSGLTRLDDQPENFLNWKSAFTSVVNGLDLQAHEQTDLLIKWLSPESSQQARRMKSANIKHPVVGLSLIWKRREELYGAPEAIEKTLFAKIDNFPKLSHRDNSESWEICCLSLKLPRKMVICMA